MEQLDVRSCPTSSTARIKVSTTAPRIHTCRCEKTGTNDARLPITRRPAALRLDLLRRPQSLRPAPCKTLRISDPPSPPAGHGGMEGRHRRQLTSAPQISARSFPDNVTSPIKAVWHRAFEAPRKLRSYICSRAARRGIAAERGRKELATARPAPHGAWPGLGPSKWSKTSWHNGMRKSQPAVEMAHVGSFVSASAPPYTAGLDVLRKHQGMMRVSTFFLTFGTVHDRKGIMVRIASRLRARLGRQDRGQRRSSRRQRTRHALQAAWRELRSARTHSR